MFGGYAPDPDPKYVITPLAGLKEIASETEFATGCKSSNIYDLSRCTEYNETDISVTVGGTQLVVVCLGTGSLSTVLKLFLFLFTSFSLTVYKDDIQHECR